MPTEPTFPAGSRATEDEPEGERACCVESVRSIDRAQLQGIIKVAGHLGAKRTERAAVELLYLNADLNRDIDAGKAGGDKGDGDRD